MSVGAAARAGAPLFPARLRAHTRRLAAHAALPTAAIALCVAAWGVGNVVLKQTESDGVTMGFLRLWLGAAAMLPLLALSRQKPSWPALRDAAPAGLTFGVNVILFFAAIKLTSIANATLITALQPALVLFIAGPMFGERIGMRQVGWVAASIAGVAIVIVGSAGSPEWSPLGDLCALAAVLLFTGYFVASKRVRGRMRAVEYNTYIQLLAALVVTPIVFFRFDQLTSVPAGDWWALAFFVFTGAGGHLLLNWAHPYVDVSVSSLMMLGVPVIGALAAWAFIGEALGPLQIIGGLIALAAIVAVLRPNSSSTRTTAPAAGVSEA